MNGNLYPAFILHKRPFRDTSLLLEIFTSDFGRISAVAKGVRGKSTRFRVSLQAFTPLLLNWCGKSELKTLRTVENNGVSFNLMGDCLFNGFYLNELLMRLLHRFDPHPEIFHDYHQALIHLQDPNPFVQQKTLRIFEKQLLIKLGYGISFDRESMTGDDIQEQKWYWFENDKGFIKCNSMHSTRLKFCGSEILAMAQDDFSNPDVLSTAKKLMRLAFARLLGNVEIKSRELFSYKILPRV